MSNSVKDENNVSSLLWISSVDWITLIPIRVNPITWRVLVEIFWLNPTPIPGIDNFWYLNVPQNTQVADYTTVLSDSGKHIYHPSSDSNDRTFTIDSNVNVPYEIGTEITFVNKSLNIVTIAIASDTLVLDWTWSSWSRTLSQFWKATAFKETATEWSISWTNLA